MLGPIGAWLLSKLLGFVSGPLVEKALDMFNAEQDRNIRKDELDAETAKAAMAAYVGLENLRVEENKTKMSYSVYWGFLALFIFPLGIYWTAILVDSLSPIINIGVVALPEPMMTWAGNMIQWLFYIGTPVAAIKILTGK